MSGLRPYYRVAYGVLVVMNALLIVNVIAIEITRPKGPFEGRGDRMALIDRSLSFFAAELFQAVLVLFLAVVAVLVLAAARESPRLVESNLLTALVLAIFAASATCAVELGFGMPDFVLLVRIAYVIIALSWAALITSIVMYRRAVRLSDVAETGS